MKVVISCAGRFHAYDLARQLARQGVLLKLYTGYPLWKVDPDLRPYTETMPWVQAATTIIRKLRLRRLATVFEWWTMEIHDAWVARRLPPCDLLVAWSAMGKRSIREAKRRGIATVCDHGSAHIVFNDEIMREEYKRHGLRPRRVDPRVVRKELVEYADADRIAIPSSFVRQTFVQQGVSESKLLVVPYGVDLRSFRPVPKEDKVFRVVYAGSVSIMKGIPYLLEAVAPLSLPDFELVLVGGIWREIEPLLTRYRGRYRAVGHVPRLELYKWYSRGSIFVLASITDGFGLVMAQAMACGLPVIATTNTGAEDLFTDGVEGFIVPIRSPEAIREKVLYLYEHPEVRDAMAQAALRRVQTIGGWQEYGERMVQNYQLLLGDKLAESRAEGCVVP